MIHLAFLLIGALNPSGPNYCELAENCWTERNEIYAQCLISAKTESDRDQCLWNKVQHGDHCVALARLCKESRHIITKTNRLGPVARQLQDRDLEIHDAEPIR